MVRIRNDVSYSCLSCGLSVVNAGHGNPMRVLLVNHEACYLGSEQSLETLALGLRGTHCQHTVVLPYRGVLTERLEAAGIAVDLLPLWTWRWWHRSAAERLKFLLLSPLQSRGVLNALNYFRRAKPDLIHFNSNLAIEPVIAAQLARIPHIIHFRDLPERVGGNFIFGKQAFLKIMGRAPVAIANSHTTAASLRGLIPSRIETVPNALDLTTFDARLGEPLPNGFPAAGKARLHVATIGSLNNWKRQEVFIEAALQICRQRDDVAFYVVGGVASPEYAASLKQLAAPAGDRIRFLGQVDAVPALLNSLDVLVHPSGRESFGRVFIEAMAASVAIVAAEGGAAREVIIDEATGLLVPNGDVPQTAQAINTLLNDPALRARLGQEGRRRVEQVYAVDKHCAAVLACYDRLHAEAT